MTNFSDTLIYSLIVTLFGMGIVFIVLIVLQYILKSMELIFHRKKSSDLAVTQVSAAKAADASAPMETAFEAYEDDEQLTAVITAAVVSCMGGNSNIIVRNIRRVNDYTPAWGKVSRTEQMANRF